MAAPMSKSARLQAAVRESPRGFLATLDFENFSEVNKDRSTVAPEEGFDGLFTAAPPAVNDLESTNEADFGARQPESATERRALTLKMMGSSSKLDSLPPADGSDAMATSLRIGGGPAVPQGSLARTAALTRSADAKAASLRPGVNIWMDH
mmetsp:Transcript_9402/g.27613  ORF Transcript_9402/g.27613 Transcript_9402/m.27613 type:complete len:151 (-) Transcript_9402:261-713(-)|eukprot:CAMPEP_0118884946 /NCGR_PEP_ID=MMETSP1163-20130328/23616_1 /TAXON_ID=124430 /ORGANISM="Phaeomonas parva, Strain CCMP2877" /LENGTH=150 /DNA_ID=CAMNT_0006822865 /DNA_START=166 /DNA_END=618 /DNA_ORIENTATION=+